MQVIPVIDVWNSVVVRAVRGERAAYRPIDSALCRGSDPATVARILCAHCAAEHLYIADLDAITGRAAQIGVIEAVAAAVPGVALWIDAGFAGSAAAAALIASLSTAVAARTVPVYGSESLRPGGLLDDGRSTATATPHGAILSLDRKAGRWLDPAGVWAMPSSWPAQVIVMTLDAVGAGAGPDLDVLHAVRSHAPDARLIGSGGIRDAADLQRAAACGAEAWLVASALHDLRLPPR